VRVGEEQRLCGCETLVQPAAFADEAAFDDRAVVDDRPFGGDQVVGLDVHADARAVAERRVFEDRGAVDFDSVADADLADEARPDDAAVASHLADLRRAFLGVGVDHFFECGDGLRAVAVNGHDVGADRRSNIFTVRPPHSFIVATPTPLPKAERRRHSRAVTPSTSEPVPMR